MDYTLANAVDHSFQTKWMTYVETRDPTLRKEIITHYLPLVYSAAKRMKMRLRHRVEVGDLISTGALGLIGSVDSFDPRKGVPFGAYCALRISGAMLDGLRSSDHLTRAVRRDGRRLDDARSLLSGKLGFRPNDVETAGYLKVTRRELNDIEARCNLTHRDTNPFADRELIEDRKPYIPMRMARQTLHDQLGEELVSLLTDVEQLILNQYYFQEQTMKQIGAGLHLSECRICQIHTRVIKRLHDASIDPYDEPVMKIAARPSATAKAHQVAA